MDSDQIHKALIGLDIAISCCTDAQLLCKAYEKQKEEDDSCGKRASVWQGVRGST